jgi:hypothetical protein
LPAFDQKLAQRTQERDADRERATDDGTQSRKPRPPVAAIALEAAERAIGPKPPELLRAIYLKVGNGGFGPGYGILGVKGAAKPDGYTLETWDHKMRKLEKENSVRRWPQQFLPSANMGCGMWSRLECAYQSARCFFGIQTAWSRA